MVLPAGVAMVPDGLPGYSEGGRPQRRPSLFKLIRGIVREADSLRHAHAQHMKSHAQAIEIRC
jgi:hypothetical protein